MSDINGTRDGVERASYGCPHCGGYGLVLIYHAGYKGRPVETDADKRQFIARAVAHCQCQIGQWIRERVDDELQRRIPRVEDILAGRSRWLLHDPSEADDLASSVPSRASVNRVFKVVS